MGNGMKKGDPVKCYSVFCAQRDGVTIRNSTDDFDAIYSRPGPGALSSWVTFPDAPGEFLRGIRQPKQPERKQHASY